MILDDNFYENGGDGDDDYALPEQALSALILDDVCNENGGDDDDDYDPPEQHYQYVMK